MDAFVTIGGAVAIGTAWVLGRTERPAYRASVRAQEYAVARADVLRLRTEADEARQDAANARADARARAGELADANAALGRVQAYADRLRTADPAGAAALDAEINGSRDRAEVPT